MKKLMIAAAIVCAAAFAQAATLNWSCYMIYDKDGTTVLQSDPGIYLAKIIAGENQIVSAVGGFEYDSGENMTGGSIFLEAGVDKDGDQFTIVTADGTALTALNGDPLVYTLSGFSSDISTPNPAAFSDAKLGAVPEPTSGLLLLLGVAGLALKRRRA